MPTELPEGLQKALEIIGGARWPEGDEDGLDRMSDAWGTMQRSLNVLDKALERSRDAVSGSMSGAYADAHAKWIDEQMRPMLDELQQEADNYSNLCKNTSADIQYTKTMIIVQLGIVAATLAFEWLPGIGQAVTAAAVATARVAISQIMKQVLQKILSHTVIGAAAGAGLMTSIDAAIQGMQMLTGERTEWNEDFTKGSAMGGALAGGMGGALSGGVRGVGSQAASGALGKGARNFANSRTGRTTENVAAAAGQGVGEVGGDAATSAAMGGKPHSEEASFLGGMIGGFGDRGGQMTHQVTGNGVDKATSSDSANVKSPSGDAGSKGLGLDGSGIATQSDGDQSGAQSGGQSGQNSSGGVQTTSTSDGAHSGDSSGNQDSSGTHSGDGQNSTTAGENTGQQHENSATAQHSGGDHGGSEQNNTGPQRDTSDNNTGGTDGRTENSDVDGTQQHGGPDQSTNHQPNNDSSDHGGTNDSPNRSEQSTPDDTDRPGSTIRPDDTDQAGSTQHNGPYTQHTPENSASHDGSGPDPGSRADSGGPDPNTATDRGGDSAPGGPQHDGSDTRTSGQEPSTQHTPDDTTNAAHSPSNASAEPNTVLRGGIGEQPGVGHTTPESGQSPSDAQAPRETPTNAPSAGQQDTANPASHNGSETPTPAPAAFGSHPQNGATPAQPPAPTNAGSTAAHTPGPTQSTPAPASHQSTPPPVADPTNRPSTTSNPNPNATPNPNANVSANPSATPSHPSTSSDGPAPRSSGESRPTTTPTPETPAARPETASAGDNKVSRNATDGESSAPPPNRPEGSRDGDGTGRSRNERIDSYRPDPARGEKENGSWKVFEDGRPFEFRTNPPSEHLLLRGDNGETFGVTPVMANKWAADNGVNIPSKGGIHEAFWNRIYPKDPSREPAVYDPNEAQRFRDDLKADSARQHADEQHREMEAANKTADWIAEKYPPEQFNYVGLGRSPAPIVAALTSHGHDTRSVPLSDFRPAPHDPNSILNRPFDEILKQPHHPTPEQHRMLDQHFKEFLGDLPGNKDVLLIDYTQGGLSLIAAQYYLQHHLNGSPNAGSEVHALAIHQGGDETTLNDTRALTVSPGTQLGKLREMLWDKETANQRQQWQDHFQKFSLGENGPLREDGPPFGRAFEKEVFDNLSEHGSYKILNQDPSTFDANRPRRDHEPTPEDEPRAYDVLSNAVRAARDPHAWDDPDVFFDARSQFSDDTYFSAPSTPASPDSPTGARDTGGEASAPSRDAGRPDVDGGSPDHTPNGPERPSAEDTTVHNGPNERAFSHPDQWGTQRDNAPVSHHRTDRFDPTKATTVDRGGNIDFAGNRTRIDHDLRRFQDHNGNWVREYTVTPDLAAHDKNLTPDGLHHFGQRVKNATENNFNGRYRLPDSGDQLHIRVEPNIVTRDDSRITSWFDDSDQQPYIKVHNTGQSSRPTQLTWDTHHPDGPLAHEIMHLLGLGEGYTDPNLVLRHPEQDGVMGRGAWDAHPGLTETNLADLERISNSGPIIRDHPLHNPDGPHHAETNNPSAATPTTIHNGPDSNQRPHTDNESSAPSSRRSGGHYTSRGNDSYTSSRGGDDYTSRRDRSPEWLYRGDTRPPEEIFPRGFTARGTNYNLEHHLHGGPRAADSGYISTTRDPHVAHQFKVQDPRSTITRDGRPYTSEETTVYQLRPTHNTIDVQARHDISPDVRSRFANQQEYAARDHIPSRNIHSSTTTRTYNWPGYDGRSQQLPGHTPEIRRYAENPWYENPHHNRHSNSSNRYRTNGESPAPPREPGRSNADGESSAPLSRDAGRPNTDGESAAPSRSHEVGFEQGSKELSGQQRGNLDSFADDVIHQARNARRAGQPLPEITITGYGNGSHVPGIGSGRAEETAAHRANTVREAINERLSSGLDQRPLPDSDFRSGDFHITHRSAPSGTDGAHTTPESRRSASVELNHNAPRAAVGAPGTTEVPKNLHMAWFGNRQQLDGELGDLFHQWQKKASDSDWRMHVWVDNRAEAANPNFLNGMRDAGVQVHNVQNPRTSDTGMTPEVAERLHYALDHDAFNMASDITRYAALHEHGGAYLDSDIAPGRFSLPHEPSRMSDGGVPFIAPAIRDADHASRIADSLQKADPEQWNGRTPTENDIVDWQYRTGELNNNLIVSPRHSPFLNDVLNNLPTVDATRSHEGSLRQDAAHLTGPHRINEQINQHLRQHGARNPAAIEFRAGRATTDPGMVHQWSHQLQWVTDQSSNQLHDTPRQNSGANGEPRAAPPTENSPEHSPNSAESRTPGHTTVHNGTSNQRFTSPDEWGPQRDNAPVSHHRTERFDPTKNTNVDHAGNIDLAGNRTRIDHDLRRFQDHNGNWIREYTVTPDLARMDPAVTPEAAHALGERVRQSVDTHLNGRYRLPDSGDQLHIRVEPRVAEWNPNKADPSTPEFWAENPGQHPYIKVYDSSGETPETANPTQLTWGSTHDGDLLAHEVLHFLGLGEGYTDPNLVLRHPEQPGAMGRDIRSRPPFLVDDNLADLERISNSGPVIRDHPNDADPVQHQHDSSTPNPDTVHTGSFRNHNPDVHSESSVPRAGRDRYVGADHLGRLNAHHAIDDTLERTDGIRTTKLEKISGYHGVKPEYYDSVTLDGIHRPEGATAGNHDTNWKAWYLAEHPDQAAGYGINDDGAAGAVLRYNLRADTTIHDIPAGRETDTNWIKRHLGIPHHQPLMDYLGERGAVLRTLENEDGDHELIIPWNLAEHGRAKHFSWLDRDGQLHLDPDGRPSPNQPHGWGRDYTNTPVEQHRPHTTDRPLRPERRPRSEDPYRPERRHPNDLLRTGHETRGARYLFPDPRTTHHNTTPHYTRPRSNETRYLDHRRHSPDTATYYHHRPLEIRTQHPWHRNRGSLYRTHGEPWAPPRDAARSGIDGESSAPPPRAPAHGGTGNDHSSGHNHTAANHTAANHTAANHTAANHPRGNETATDHPQHGTAHEPLRGEADSRPLPRIAVTDEEGRPALTTWQSLPAWVRGSRSLGSIASHHVDASGLGDLVRTMLPEGPRGTRPVGVERVEPTAHHDFESFLDRGRSFPVRSGKEWYEAHVRAVFPDSPESTPDTAAMQDPTQNITKIASGTDSAHTSAISTTRSLGTSIEGGPLVGPYGRVGLRAPLARPSLSRSDELSSAEEHEFRTTGGTSKADAPVRFEVQLTDSDGATVPQHPETPTAITGRASLQIPHDLGTFHDPGQVRAGNPDAGWAARLDHPATEAVVLGDDRFHDVAERLHPSITRLGAPGRQELEHFLSSANVRTNFGQLLQGWVLSPELVSAHGNRGSAVQMTASASEPELVGVTDAGFTRAHDSASSSSVLSSATKSGFEGNLAAGGSAISGSPLGGSAMLTAGHSAHATATNKVGGQHTSKVAMQVKGDVGIYEAKVDLTVATRNGEPIRIPATAHMRIGLPEAAEQGLPVPHGTRASIATPTAEKRFPPPYLAAKAAMGNVKVSGHGPANRALPHVQDALSALGEIGDFLPKWGDPHTTPERTGKHLSDEREKFNNLRKLTTALSPGALRAKWDALLGQGADVQLKKRGMFTNDYVNVRVRARIGDGEHLGEAGERSVRASASTAPTTGTSTTLTKGWSAGVEGRMLHLGVVDHHRLAVAPTASLKYTSTTTRTQSANPSETHAPIAVGSPKSQIFRHDTELDVEITSYSRPRAWVKRLTPGSPTRTVPEPQVLARTVREGEAAPDGARALPPISGKTTLWVPDGTTEKHDQGQFRPGEPTSRELGERDPRSIRELLDRGDRPGRTEGLHVEAVTGTEFLRDAALGHLHRAADGDGVLGLPGSAARKEIDDFFSPEHIAANLARLSDHGGYVDGLHYDRRVHDRIGSVGTSYELKNPTLVSVADDISTENSTTGGHAVGETTGKSRGWDLDLSLNHTARPETGPADGASYVSSAVAAAKPWSRSTTRSTGDELSGTVERTRTTPEQARTALVRMDADVTLIAESQQRNVLHSTTPQRSGSVVTLPGGAFVRVDEEQARALGVLPDRRAPEPQVPESERLAPPRLFGRHQPSSIGLSMVDTSPDLRGLLGDMRAKLGDRGAELLPDSVLDDAMRNQHKLVNLTSPGHVHALQDSALDGGITTLAHAPGFFGRTTYWSQLRAQLDGEPEFLDVVHDGVEMDHTVRGSTKHTAADGKTSGWSVGLRGPSGAAPGTGNPDISSTAGTGAGAEVSAGQQHSTGTSSARTSKASRLSTASGPAARYQVPLRFELVTGRGDEPGTVVSTETRPMRMRVHANNVPTAGHEPAPVQDYSVQAHERVPADTRPEGIRAWQQEDAAALPHTAVAEALRGSTDLREGAGTALTNAGASKRITGPGTPAAHALHSALSPEMLQAQLVGGRTDPLRVPHLHAISLLTGEHADVEVHRRLSRPRLVGLSDHVTMADERAETSTRSAENSHTGTGSATAAPGAGRTVLPDPDPGGAMISSTGAEHARARGDVDGSSGGSTGTKTNNVKVAGRSGLVEYDADYRIVATSGGNVGVVDVHVPASTHVRMDESGLRSALHRDLPDSLRSGQDRLKRAADDWREAEMAGDRALHASDDRINENAPRRDAAHRALEARQAETAAARDRLARAEQRVEQARSRSADEQARLPEFQARARAHVDELSLKADSALARVWSAGASRAETENAVRDLQQQGRTDEVEAARQSYADALAEERQAAADHARWDAEFRSATAEAERAPAAAEEATAEFRTAEQEQHRSQESLEQARAREGSAHLAVREAEDEVATSERDLDAAREQVRAAKKAWLSAKTAVDDEIRAFNGTEQPNSGAAGANSGAERATSDSERPAPPRLDPIPEDPDARPQDPTPSTPDSTERANPEPGAQQQNGLASFLHPERNP